MEMTDILPAEGWAELERDIAARFGLNAHAYNAQGSSFTGHATWVSPLCTALRQSKTAASGICAVINQTLGHEMRQTGAAVVSDCDAGMLVISVPVFVDGELVGSVGGCGALVDDNEPETFLLEKMAGLSEERVEEICSGMRRKTAAEAAEISDYIEARVADIMRAFEAGRTAK